MQKILLKKSKIYDNNSQGSRYRRNIVVFQLLSRVQLFTTLWIIAHQASLSMGLSRQEYWSGYHALLQGIFPTQGWNPYLLHYRWILYHWAPKESPRRNISQHNKGPTANIILNGEKLKAFPLRSGTRMPTLASFIQYSIGSHSHSNQTRKSNKKNQNWK